MTLHYSPLNKVLLWRTLSAHCKTVLGLIRGSGRAVCAGLHIYSRLISNLLLLTCKPAAHCSSEDDEWKADDLFCCAFQCISDE